MSTRFSTNRERSERGEPPSDQCHRHQNPNRRGPVPLSRYQPAAVDLCKLQPLSRLSLPLGVHAVVYGLAHLLNRTITWLPMPKDRILHSSLLHLLGLSLVRLFKSMLVLRSESRLVLRRKHKPPRSQPLSSVASVNRFCGSIVARPQVVSNMAIWCGTALALRMSCLLRFLKSSAWM